MIRRAGHELRNALSGVSERSKKPGMALEVD
jgi:hypothetical protein